MMKTFFSILCLLVIGTSPLSAQKKASGDRLHMVVIQLTSGDTLAWKGAVKNITHLLDTWGDKVKIELVAHGSGVEFLIVGKSTQEQKVADLASKGVRFLACENSLRDRKLTRENVLTAASTVPSGVVEVVTKEEDGWSYLKAGF
jgi:intracellular sulfur oxidation DsrE/DsrF family protein